MITPKHSGSRNPGERLMSCPGGRCSSRVNKLLPSPGHNEDQAPATEPASLCAAASELSNLQGKVIGGRPWDARNPLITTRRFLVLGNSRRELAFMS